MGKLDRVVKMIKSLRFRIIVMIIVAGIIPVTLLSMFLIMKYETIMIEDKIGKLEKAAAILKNDILESGYFENSNSEIVDAQITSLIAENAGRIMIIDKNYIVLEDTYNIDKGKTCLSDIIVDCINGSNQTTFNKDERSILISCAIYQGDDTVGAILFDFPITDIDNIVSAIKDEVIVVLIIASIIIAAIAGASAFYTALPFKRMKHHIRQLAAGETDNGYLGYTEMEEVNESMEEVILRLKKLDESREEFVSNVSHELKTPITSIKVLADSLLAQDNVPAEMYKEFMQDIASEIERESSIINDLLALVRLNKTSSNLVVSQVNIVEIVEMVIKRVNPIARKKNIEIILENFKPVTAEVDEVKITMVITNLIENAVKYNVLDGWVRVSVNADLTYFYLKVADSGIGIPEDSQMQVFERFYRVDKARSRETGGTGLGLAITKTVVNLHKGELKLYSKEGEGSIFTVRIPLHYVS